MIKKLISIPIIALMITLPTVSAWAELIVVDDRGGAPVLPYYEAIGITPEPTPMVQRQPAPMSNEAFALPVRSRLLTPGRVEPRPMNVPGLMPFFLVGDDDVSRQWLRERGDMLRGLGASGLVVNVESLDALQALRRLAPGLTLSPVSGDDLAQRLRLTHYPALITTTGIEP